MRNIYLGLMAFVVIFGGALIGMFAARVLPADLLSSATQSTVNISMAVVGTLAALVLGLMTPTASSSFSGRSDKVSAISVDYIRIDRYLRRLGPEAGDARARLRKAVKAKRQELFPAPGEPPLSNDETAALLDELQDSILALSPADPLQTHLQSSALALTVELSEARWLLVQQAHSNIPLPFLIVLMFWLALVFASFGLFAPLNSIAAAALFLCAVAVAGCITIILELDSPLSGIIRLSHDPLSRAVAVICD